MSFWDDINKGADDMWEMEQVSGGGGGGGDGNFDIIGFLLKILLGIIIFFWIVSTIYKLFN